MSPEPDMEEHPTRIRFSEFLARIIFTSREQLGICEFKFSGLEKFYLQSFYAENIYPYIQLAILLFIFEMIYNEWKRSQKTSDQKISKFTNI